MRISDWSSDVCSSDLGFKLGTRVYLTLPNGERASFTFAPVEEKIGGQTFDRPAWVADGDHGFVLASVDAQLRRIGAAFFLVDGGAGYNPGAAQFCDSDYSLPGPDGPAFVITGVRRPDRKSAVEGKSV